ncbi:hypothetical protein EON71_00155 [bacterium]|nr:MAG: hypothetical protein EON71_00155 [bacterium]
MNINPRLKKLKHKQYRRLRADIWGTVGLKNKKNQITKKLKTYLEQDFKYKIKNYNKINKTKAYLKTEKKALFSRFYIRKKKKFFQRFEFDFNVVAKAQEKRKKRQSYRGILLNQRRRFLIFFGEHFLRKQLRKITKSIKISRNRFLERKFTISFPSQKNFGSIFGSRIDLLLFRSNFCTTMRQSRQLVKHNKVLCMVKSSIKNFFEFKKIKNLGFSVPIYSPIILNEHLQHKRKNLVRHLLLKNLLYYARPKDLFIDYKSFMSFRIYDTNHQRLPFGANLSYFAGLSKFF